MIKIILFLTFIASFVYSSEFSARDNACKHGIVEACVEFAEIYEQGDSISVDLNKADYYYQLACKLDDTLSCAKHTAYIKNIKEK